MKQMSDRFAAVRSRSTFWRTLRFRFALWVAAFMLALLVTFGLFVYERLARGLWTATEDALRLSAAQAIAALIYDGGQLHLPATDSENTVAAELQERGLTIRLYTPDGTLIQASGAFATLPVGPDTLAAVRRGHNAFTTVRELHDDERVRIYSAPVVQDGTLVGIIEVARSIDHIDDTLGQLQAALLIGVPLLSVIAGGGSYWLAGRALARIDRITRTVRRISAEDLSTRLNFPPIDDEVGRLATTFDAMLARLDDSFERERRFTADASHELRTPITAIQIILGTTLEHRRTPAEYEQALGDIAEEADRLRVVAEDLLVLARRDGRSPAPRESVDLSVLLQDVTESLRPLAEEKGLELTLTVWEPLLLSGDSDGLIRLFVNLLENAIKYTDQGAITVQALRTPDDRLQVTVTDTGCGIPPESLPHVFDRFYRVETSRTTRGAGLGLTIAKEIAQAHGGTIAVTSVVGTGTSFVVTLRPTQN
jgi:heavy metal sensor kinase